MSYSFALIKAVAIATPLALMACGDRTEQPKGLAPPVSAVAQQYEGKIVRQAPGNRGKDDGWYLVKNGSRRWISDGSWLEKNGYQPSAVIEISSADFHAIPEDPQPLK